jgi:hypothetical protein
MLHSELDGLLDVFRCSGIDANDWYTPLLARNTKCSVQVASLDRPVRKSVCLPVSVFSSARLIRSPETVEPTSTDIGAVL